jgi:phosphopantetheine adenylyltransferase
MNDSDRLFASVIGGRVGVVTVAPDGTISGGVAEELSVLSGAFNPLHEGHEGMLKAAVGITGSAGVFELSIVNVDKPELPEDEVRERMSQFAGRYTALISRAPTFLEKSRIMPGASFVIGYDTAVRLFDDRYYPAYQRETDPDNTGSATLAAMSEIRRNGCEFIVAGRVTEDGFKTVQDLDIPDGYREMLRGIPVEMFREDISSTQIRRSSGND